MQFKPRFKHHFPPKSMQASYAPLCTREAAATLRSSPHKLRAQDQPTRGPPEPLQQQPTPSTVHREPRATLVTLSRQITRGWLILLPQSIDRNCRLRRRSGWKMAPEFNTVSDAEAQASRKAVYEARKEADNPKTLAKYECLIKKHWEVSFCLSTHMCCW